MGKGFVFLQTAAKYLYNKLPVNGELNYFYWAWAYITLYQWI